MSVRIAHVSDVHFGGELPDAVAAAAPAIADFDPDVVAVTGDITLNGLPREFRAARAWLDRFSAPVVVTPGNHDTPYWNLVLRALTPFSRYRRYIGVPDSARIDLPGLSIRALNSARGAQPRLNWSKGAINLKRLATIDWGDEGGSALKVFACHHPLVELKGAPVTGGVHRGARGLEILTLAGVELVLTGHVHVPFALPMSEAGHTCYAIGAGTLSQRLRGVPPSFSTIVADERWIEVTIQAWDGSCFQAADCWRLPRVGKSRASLPLPGPAEKG